MRSCKLVTIALLGAAGTGKKSLAAALRQAFAAAPAPLRWQITTDTPLQHLLGLASASASHPKSTLDTESIEFQAALAHQRRFDHSLLLGLDLTPLALERYLPRASEPSRMDTLLRRSLTQANLPFQVIYGEGDERLRQALSALGALNSAATLLDIPPAETSSPRKPWVWACDKCSDPACEHRLLSDLLLKR